MSKQVVLALPIIQRRTLLVRGQKVLLSRDLAQLYGVSPKVLIQAVKRNARRFPEDFMFCLTFEETKTFLNYVLHIRSQNVTLKRGQHVKHPPYAFTEQGVAMLSSVLKSQRAIQVNIAIMRAFVSLRDMLSEHKEFVHKLDELERKLETHDIQIRNVFEVIRQLMRTERSRGDSSDLRLVGKRDTVSSERYRKKNAPQKAGGIFFLRGRRDSNPRPPA